jgi:hypothetical protein
LPEIAAARGYWSAQRKTELKQLGFGDRQCTVPALVAPVWTLAGEIGTYQIRPDQPRINHDGKPIKYETPGKSRLVLDVHPFIREKLRDPGVPLFITEGVRKADAGVSVNLCCVGVLGVWAFRGTNEFGGKTALPDWEYIALNGRDVYICFDSDVMTKPQVHAALVRLKAFLEQRGANVRLIYLPPTADGRKVGLDDYVAAGRSVEDLLALASDEMRSAPQTGTEPLLAGPYRETEDGLVWLKHTRDGEIPTPLTNFRARIVSQVIEDDGAETRRLIELEARMKGRVHRFTMRAGELAGMNWPLEHLGSGAVVYAGFGVRDHVRAAIQLSSGDAPERRVYTHTGWRMIDGGWCYLHGGGAIGPVGPVQDVSVELPGRLGLFVLPEPPEGERLKEAVRASVALLDVAPHSVTVPIFCAIWRAAMGACDFSEHLFGPTGEGKTELSALAQQHWGKDLSSRNLPGNWASTSNALEGLAFQAKDALLVIDDFAPSGGATEISRYHRDADRLLRAQANRAGRQRMRADTSLRPAKPPRGLILSTGEDIPRGWSLGARMLAVELPKDAMNWNRLTECQQQAAEGKYADAMAGYLRWIAPQYEEVLSHSLQAQMLDLRQAATRSRVHKRTPEIVANLAIGLRSFLAFAQEVGAMSAEEAADLWRQGWKALGESASAHSAHQAAAHPADLFVRLLRAAIASGRGHLAGPDGGEPEAPKAWGWREERGERHPLGSLVGWVAGADVYLEPDAAYAAAQSLGQATGDGIPVQPRTLHKRLHEKGLLASVDETRKTCPVRKTLAGARRTVLHLRASSLLPDLETDQTDQTGQDLPDGDRETQDGQLPGQFPAFRPERTDQPNCPQVGSEDQGTTQRDGVGSSVSSQEQEAPGGIAAAASRESAGPMNPPRPCYACKGTRFWRDHYGVEHCAVCHPPADERMVMSWVRAPAASSDMNGGKPGAQDRLAKDGAT